MKMRFIILLCLLSFSFAGCSFSNEALLVDSSGHLFYGKATFNPESHNGTLTFRSSPYGELSGPFTLVLTDEKNPIIKLERIPLQRYSGKARLSSEGNPKLECDITADFKTGGMGDMKMTGCGTCSDKNKNTYDISFN